jgi:hypothetical protein
LTTVPLKFIYRYNGNYIAHAPKYRHATKNSCRCEPYCDSNIILHSSRQLKNNQPMKSSKDIHLPTEELHEAENEKPK